MTSGEREDRCLSKRLADYWRRVACSYSSSGPLRSTWPLLEDGISCLPPRSERHWHLPRAARTRPCSYGYVIGFFRLVLLASVLSLPSLSAPAPFDLACSPTTCTIACLPSAPCRVRVGSRAALITSPASFDVTGSRSGLIFVWLDSASMAFVVGSSGPEIACHGCQVVSATSQFPIDCAPLYSLTTAYGKFDPATITDFRSSIQLPPRIQTGPGLMMERQADLVRMSVDPTSSGPPGTSGPPGNSSKPLVLNRRTGKSIANTAMNFLITPPAQGEILVYRNGLLLDPAEYQNYRTSIGISTSKTGDQVSVLWWSAPTL